MALAHHSGKSKVSKDTIFQGFFFTIFRDILYQFILNQSGYSKSICILNQFILIIFPNLIESFQA